MNLIIDVGNSFVKLAVFQGDTLKFKKSVELETILDEIKELKQNFPIKRAIVSSVGKLNAYDAEQIAKHFRVLVLNSETNLPFTNLYQTPKTLGVDRIALVSGAAGQFPNEDVLIIDAGTCITYDFINSENEYLGGAISPGVRMRYEALNNLTANLPLLDTEQPKHIIGGSTQQSIHSGVVHGILNEIDGAVQAYRLKYPDLTVILTGGDTNFLSKQLKSSIFANPNFLLEGLNYILQFNSNE
ncbi:type III pantothenate kinase [Tamlana crocina]|uniref:Type III pantothenate kinase n=1 Tax=Tamlana crocina TaxID=393006 RepID=A0ABX1DDR9_9FLAO|nr:type III pantothenate kinase [Tamlana crocina]NJX16212.1 type III pantothenate kinase [Tamlana crocina]